MTNKVNIGKDKNVILGEGQPLTLIAGPCVIESKKHCIKMANSIKKICDKLNIQYIFKSSYIKENRTSIESFTGIGIDEGLSVLSNISEKYNIPVTSDVSDISLVEKTAKNVDLIQIPAFLCRQTRLLVSAAKTGLPINIKKGQFLSPWNIHYAVKKIESTGNKNIILTERGTSFGYNMLINDMRGIKIMGETGYPICYDVTHSIQTPGGLGSCSGGQREFIPKLTSAAIAMGVHVLFMEVHDNPSKALCDSSCQLAINKLEPLLKRAKIIYETVQKLEKLETK